MGAEFWSCFVPYQPDLQAALDSLREREFKAGRFRQPIEVEPGFFGKLIGRGPSKPKPPATIQEAVRIASYDATGTRSILDMERISSTPDYSAVTPLSKEELISYFRTEQPTRKMLDNLPEELIDRIERGQGISIVTFRDGKPDEIYFAGYSFD